MNDYACILIWDAHTRMGHNIGPYAYGISHTHMGRPIRVWDIILAHTRTGYPIRIWDVPYAYGPIYAYGAEHYHKIMKQVQISLKPYG